MIYLILQYIFIIDLVFLYVFNDSYHTCGRARFQVINSWCVLIMSPDFLTSQGVPPFLSGFMVWPVATIRIKLYEITCSP